ncbi:MAG: hypothetical protein WCF84_20045 [Anaerolineae bacterium]
MVNLEIAYALIAIVLVGYGALLYRRSRAVQQRIRELQEEK